MRFPFWRLACAGMLALATSTVVAEDNANTLIPGDGWYHWRVEAVDPAPNWCCYTWKSSASKPVACDLDRKSRGFGTSDAISPGSAVMHIYARQQDGKITDVRAYGPACEVHSKSAIVDLGQLDDASSLALLQAAETGDADQKLAAISIHAGSGTRVLIGMIEDRSRPFAERSKALFWLAESDSGAGVDYIQKLLSAR